MGFTESSNFNLLYGFTSSQLYKVNLNLTSLNVLQAALDSWDTAINNTTHVLRVKHLLKNIKVYSITLWRWG